MFPLNGFGTFTSTLTVKLFEYLAKTFPEFIIFLKFLSADYCHLIVTFLLNVGETFVHKIMLVFVGSPLATP